VERAEATTTATWAGLTRTHQELDQTRTGTVAAIAAARADADTRQTEALAAAVARYDGELAGLRGRYRAAQEVAGARHDELTRLAALVDDCSCLG